MVDWGSLCHWNFFRVYNTTQMEANAAAGSWIKQYGKNFYYLTTGYACGHDGYRTAALAQSGQRGSRGMRKPTRRCDQFF